MLLREADVVRDHLFLINRVPGMRPVHYGDALVPYCRIMGLAKPLLTSWFSQDVTCKRCLRMFGVKS